MSCFGISPRSRSGVRFAAPDSFQVEGANRIPERVSLARVEHDHDGRLSYAEELDLARTLIAQGDRSHALYHCVTAMSLELHRHEWRSVLTDLLSEPALVAKLEADTFWAAYVARAFYHHERGDTAKALDVLSRVIAAMPHLGLQAWFTAWLAESPGVHVDAACLQRMLALATRFGVGRIRMLPAEQAAAEELVPVAELAVRAHDDPALLWLASATLRRAGRYREALAVAERARPLLAPNLGTVAVGLALRGAGDFDRAVEELDALYRSNGEIDFLHEKKRALADAGRWAEAVAAADEIERLSEIVEENVREHALLRANLANNAPPPEEPPLDIVRRRALGHGHLPSMLDATANGLRSYASQWSTDTSSELVGMRIRKGRMAFGVSGDEGASNRLAVALMFAGVADPRRAEYSINGSVLRSVREHDSPYTLWKAAGDVAVQALTPPPDAVLDWVEGLALFEPDGTLPETLFAPNADFLDMWRAAKQRPTPPGTARDWVAAAIYPRMPLCRVWMGPDWVFRWQVAALIGLAHSEREWANSARRDAFLSLLQGSIDWPLAAAIRVLAEIALEEPATTADIRSRLIDLSEALEPQPNMAFAWALYHALDALPNVPDHVKDALRERHDPGEDDDVDVVDREVDEGD